ncbi:MAG: EamA family transporter [Myxococcales bacterium]|nr:EamA family transporter [Myxococcales bacterium]
MLERVPHRLAVVLAAAMFSTGGAAIKACGLTGYQVASFRSGVAAVTLALLVPGARRGWTWRTLLVGVSYAATMILFAVGNKLTTAANSIFLQSAAPLYILLLAPWLLKERIQRRDLGLMAAIALGLALILSAPESARGSATDPLRGNVFGVASGITWALTLIGLRWLERAPSATPRPGLAAVTLGNALACVLALPWALPVGAITTPDLGLVVYLGAIQIGLAYVFLTHGFRHVPAFEASLLILVEPTLSPIWAWLIHHEVPGWLAIAGGVVVLGATTAKTWLDQRARRLAPP